MKIRVASDNTFGPARFFEVDASRFIALGRLAFSAIALLGVFLDPLQPVLHAELGYGILVAYVVWSLGIALYVRNRLMLRSLAELAIFIVDILVIAVLMLLTEGYSSPFFIYFAFSLIAAMLRWSWRGVIATAVVALAIFFTLTLRLSEEVDLLRVFIRSGYLTVLAGMLSLLAMYIDHIKWNLGKVSEIRTAHLNGRVTVNELLEHAISVLEAACIVLVWKHVDDATTSVDIFPAVDRSNEIDELVIAPGFDEAFISTVTVGGGVQTLYMVGQHFWEVSDNQSLQPLHNGLGAKRIVSVPMSGDVNGRLFILDPPRLGVVQLLFGRIVGEQIARGLTLNRAMDRLRQASADEERVRLARDIHDGALQTLVGARLQLDSIRHALPEEFENVRNEIGSLETIIAGELTSLRGIVDELKPARRDAQANAI
jgi:signal transduction histidine kinase